MKAYVWSPGKNRALKADGNRNICFEDIVAAIEAGGLLDDIRHPNVDKYPGQRILIVFVKYYVYPVPYVATAEGIFLKTAFPSRQLKAIHDPGARNA